jgi:hypothetical protein
MATTNCDNFLLEAADGELVLRFSAGLAYGRGAKMRQEVYRVAFDEARAELNEILGKFEQLRLRKDRIEQLVEALKPLVTGYDIPVSPSTSADRAASSEQAVPLPAPEPVAAAASPIPYPVKQAIEPANDPFSRRADNAVGVGAGANDVKEYSRLFNTSTRAN